MTPSKVLSKIISHELSMRIVPSSLSEVKSLALTSGELSKKKT
uniref:Uncharacterized protein n=1 Tax=Arundo donax TaxID=35708 RepID=A0A0A9AX93_ARUDO